MAKFKITPTTTVAELKERFRNEIGGVLRVYEGRSQAPADATLVSLGAKEGELECRTSRTVGKFEEAFQKDLNLKVKVYTKDENVSVLDGITLATVKEIPNMSTHAKMEKYLAYQKEGKEEENAEVVNEETTESEDVELFKGVIPKLVFSPNEKCYAVEHGEGIVLMARELKDFSNLDILVDEYAREEEPMVLIAINKNNSEDCAAVDIYCVGVEYVERELKKHGITSYDDYKFYYTYVDPYDETEEEFIENTYHCMYLNKDRAGLYEDQEFDRKELIKTINKEYRHCSDAHLDIFNGKKCIYSCDGVVVSD